MHVVDIIKAIADAKTSKEKDAIILEHKDSVEFKLVVEMALNTELSFHITSVEYMPPRVSLFSEAQTESLLTEATGMLERLNLKGSCDGSDRHYLTSVYSCMNAKDRQAFDIILSRKIQCGAGLPKFRKVWGADFLPDFPCYLSSAFDEAAIIKYIFDGAPYAFSDVKSDGQRAEAKKSKKQGCVIHSRNGKQYHGLHDMEMEIDMLQFEGMDEWVLDGEFVIIDDDGIMMSRKDGNAKISKAISNKVDPNYARQIVFVVWDLIPMKEFTGKIPMGHSKKMPYHERRRILHEGINAWGSNRIILQKTRKVKDIGEAMTHYAELVAEGEEGSILKRFDGEWDPCPNKKRPNTQFKFKEVFAAEFKIVGWYKGDKKGKYKDAIGGFYIESSDGKVKSKCGGGLTDDVRFSDPEQYMQQIGTFEYNARSEAEGRDTWSLTHPRLDQFRPDKNEADSLERIIEQEEATREIKRCMGMK